MKSTRRLLAEVRGRWALMRVVHDLQGSLLPGALAALVVLCVRVVWLHEIEIRWAVVAGSVVWLLPPLGGMILRRPNGALVAAETDRRLGLEDRVSTAVWCNAEPGVSASPFEELVVQDAERSAAQLDRSRFAGAFPLSLRRRPVALAVATVGLCVLVSLFHPDAHAVETESQQAARLLDEERIARVARQLREAAKRVEQAAGKEQMATLKATAAAVRREAEAMIAKPPRREEALTKLGELRDLTRAAARKAAGMPSTEAAPEAAEQSRQLSKLLKDLAKAGLESLQEDLEDMAERLAAGEQGVAPPSPEEMRSLADRIDQLRRSVERMAGEEGSRRMAEALRSMGNEDVLEKIRNRLRELATKVEQGQGYESLDGGEGGESLDLSKMSREDLEQLLRDLDELASMEDLGNLMSQAGSAARGGRRLKFRPGQGGGT